jgi:hypothetical protein
MKKSRKSKNNCVLVVHMIWIDNLSIEKQKTRAQSASAGAIVLLKTSRSSSIVKVPAIRRSLSCKICLAHRKESRKGALQVLTSSSCYQTLKLRILAPS